MYSQIASQIKHAVANNQVQPGNRLPTVRELASKLNINPGTVFRAYRELEQEGIIVSRRGGGTTVAANPDISSLSAVRQKRLSNLVSDHILQVLSLGYTPEELEAESSLNLSRWREERRKEKKPSEESNRAERSGIKIVASHDLALDFLVNKLKVLKPDLDIGLNYAGSLGGLIALQEGRADIAGIHLLDEETGEYNYPYLKHLLPGRKLAVVHLAYRIQGLMFAGKNPRQISGFNDLTRPDIVFVNRQPGSGTRVLLDYELRKNGINPEQIRGYGTEVDTHSAVALSVSQGQSDVGLGIQAAADANDLDFLPLLRERYDLVMPAEVYRNKSIAPLIETINSPEFKSVVENIGGYDISQAGSATFFP